MIECLLQYAPEQQVLTNVRESLHHVLKEKLTTEPGCQNGTVHFFGIRKYSTDYISISQYLPIHRACCLSHDGASVQAIEKLLEYIPQEQLLRRVRFPGYMW